MAGIVAQALLVVLLISTVSINLSMIYSDENERKNSRLNYFRFCSIDLLAMWSMSWSTWQFIITRLIRKLHNISNRLCGKSITFKSEQWLIVHGLSSRKILFVYSIEHHRFPKVVYRVAHQVHRISSDKAHLSIVVIQIIVMLPRKLKLHY